MGNLPIYVLLTIALICVLLLCGMILSNPNCVPEDGQWYCAELALTIGIKDDSYVISEKGERVECLSVFLDGDNPVTVHCTERDHAEWKFHEVVFSGECIKLEKDSLWIRERHTDEVYIFVRQP